MIAKQKNAVDPIAILNQIPTPVMALGRDFRLHYANSALCALLDKQTKDIIGRHCYDVLSNSHCRTDECRVAMAMDSEKVFVARSELRLPDRTMPIEYTAAPLRDEQGAVIGGLEYIIDITERVEMDEKIRQQQQEIMELSTPVVAIWGGVLALPLIGTLDSKRMQETMEIALNRMTAESARILIVDITGVVSIDTMVANHLIRMATAVRLMGGDCVLTGISPATAKTIVHLGIDLSALVTRATLAQGLRWAIEHVNAREEG